MLPVIYDELSEAKKRIKASSEKPLPQGICPFRENQLNINADLTVPVCCLVFNRNHLVSNNYLDTSLQDINLKIWMSKIKKKEKTS